MKFYQNHKKTIFAPYARWEAVQVCKRLPQGVRTFCPPGEPILRLSVFDVNPGFVRTYPEKGAFLANNRPFKRTTGLLRPDSARLSRSRAERGLNMGLLRPGSPSGWPRRGPNNMPCGPQHRAYIVSKNPLILSKCGRNLCQRTL